VGKSEGNGPLGKPKPRWTILKRNFKKQDRQQGLDWCGSEQRKVVGSCEHGNEHWDSIKCGEFE